MLDDRDSAPEPNDDALPRSGRNWLTWIADRNPFFLNQCGVHVVGVLVADEQFLVELGAAARGCCC